jgi:hypothetical protein
MGLAVPHLERLALGVGHRPARNGRGLASQGLPMKPGFGLNKSVCHLHCCHLANLV